MDSPLFVCSYVYSYLRGVCTGSSSAFLIANSIASYISNSKKIVDLSRSAQMGGGGILDIQEYFDVCFCALCEEQTGKCECWQLGRTLVSEVSRTFNSNQINVGRGAPAMKMEVSPPHCGVTSTRYHFLNGIRWVLMSISAC